MTNKRKATRPKPAPAAGTVEGFLTTLTHPLKPEIEALRKVILKADGRITEGIKWNAPSFQHGDWFATFDLRSPKWVQIILHRGAKPKAVGSARYVADPDGILQWITNDRAVARFVSADDVKAKARALTAIVAAWVQHLDAEAM